MLTGEAMQAVEFSDSELVADSLGGNRDAFRRIVERYQTLISSLAYSATGSVSRSEDLAQETFVRAWTQLARLREPAKLRPWLCSITRFLISKEYRLQGREPVHAAEPLDAVEQWVSPEPLPPDHAISEEEQAILWRSLERIPDLYREPLVLFYREHQSIKTVAQDLGLSEDVVKQRLSRGRKLLQEQVLGFIEGALERTKPQQAFTLAVLASLPGLTFSAQAAVAGAVAKSGTTAKAAGALGVLGAMLGPLIVFLPNYLAYRVSLTGAYSDEERAAIKSLYAKVAGFTLALFIPLAAMLVWLTWGQANQSVLSGLFAGCLVVIFVPTIFILAFASARKDRGYHTRLLEQEYNGVFPKPDWEYRSKATLFGLPLVHIRAGDRFAVIKKPVKAWVAVGHTAIGGLFALGVGTIAPISIGGFSIGLVSLGGLAVGGVCAGGIALGAWPVFGGLLVGWQAFNGCFAIAWNEAVGLCAMAHDYALGQFAHAAQTNNDIARQAIFPNPMFRLAEVVGRRWIWLNLFWIVPFLVMWLMARKRRQQPENA
jgi:RNA polymerase sigma factor (sigma-70 family)